MSVTAICQSRGGVTVNNLPGIAQVAQTEIVTLNDLAGLIKMQSVLTELDTNLNAIERFSTPTAVKISQALATASGATAFEKYLNALQSVCGDNQCSALPSADRSRAVARLNLLRAALTQIQGIQLSAGALTQLAGFEGQQTDVGVTKTLAAVNALIAQMASELNLTSAQQSEQAINALIAQRCQAGVQQATPPIIPPPIQPPVQPPVQPPPAQSLLYGGGSINPAYTFQVYGEGDAPVESGPALHGRAALGFNISNKLRLQIDYNAMMNVAGFDNFTSRMSQDLAVISAAYRLNLVELIPQASFLWARDIVGHADQLVGAAGLGASFLDGLAYVFGGGIFGTTFGGYGGLRSSHEWESPKLGVSGQVFCSYADTLQVAASVTGSYSPVSFGGGDLDLALSAGGSYDVTASAANVTLMLMIGWNMDVIYPQPIRWGGN